MGGWVVGWVSGWSNIDNKANLSPAELRCCWHWAELGNTQASVVLFNVCETEFTVFGWITTEVRAQTNTLSEKYNSFLVYKISVFIAKLSSSPSYKWTSA